MNRGDIWQVDLGYSGKVRPVLILSIDYNDDERAIVTYIPRTTSVWPHNRFDIPHKARGMKDGAFAVQLIGSISNAKYLRKVGQVDTATLQKIEETVRLWLGL